MQKITCFFLLLILWAGTAVGSMESGRLKLDIEQFPPPAVEDPLYEVIPHEPIVATQFRYRCYDSYSRVLAVRFYEPGLPEYPHPLDTDGIALQNLAAGALITSSNSAYGTLPENVLTDSPSNDSRWIGSGGNPNELLFEFDAPVSVGCIQFLTGYFSVGIVSPDVNYTLEYYSDGEWALVEGATTLELGSLEVIAGEEAGGAQIKLVHQQESPQWSIRRATASNEVNLAQADQPEVFQSGETYLVDVLCTSNQVVYLLNGNVLLHAPLSEPLSGGFSASACNDDTVIQSELLSGRALNADNESRLANLRLLRSDVSLLNIDFAPDHPAYTVLLPGSGPETLTLEFLRLFPGQSVRVNDQPVVGDSIAVSVDDGFEAKIEVKSPGATSAMTYTLVFSAIPSGGALPPTFADEFDDPDYSPSWTPRVGRRFESIQVEENSSVQGGNAVIKLDVDEESGLRRTGGFISKQRFGYGYYEARVKLPPAAGWHSAFWQKGHTVESDPNNPSNTFNNSINEIDGFESANPEKFSFNLHYHNPHRIAGAEGFTLADHGTVGDYNIFGWEWTPTSVRYFLNGKMLHEEDYLPPHGLQNVWLSCVGYESAVTSAIPYELLFDYFRFYQSDDRIELPDGAALFDYSHSRYSETGSWETDALSVNQSHTRDMRLSFSTNAAAGWNLSVVPGVYELFAWNPYTYLDGPVLEYAFQISTSNHAPIERSYNPMKSGQTWVSLGIYTVPADGQIEVQSHNPDGLPLRADSIALVPSRPDLRWEFGSDGAEGWNPGGAVVASNPDSDGAYLVTTDESEVGRSLLIHSDLNFQAGQVPTFRVRCKSDGGGQQLRLFWADQTSTVFEWSRFVTSTDWYAAGSGFVETTFNMADHPYWAGMTVESLRLDLVEGTNASTWVDWLRATDGDMDDDGISDDIEAQQSSADIDGDGIDNMLDTDSDSDGQSDADEHTAGVDPYAASDRFEIASTSTRPASSEFVIHWNAVEGRAYNIYSTTNLSVPFTLLQSGIPSPKNSYTAEVQSVEDTQYYKLGVGWE